ncbi:hypothetical protein HK101_000891 [Irineochytrium annulatum]|nr:hypothetical protein HK101_000891 [Irineochytrium annulatum]
MDSPDLILGIQRLSVRDRPGTSQEEAPKGTHQQRHSDSSIVVVDGSPEPEAHAALLSPMGFITPTPVEKENRIPAATAPANLRCLQSGKLVTYGTKRTRGPRASHVPVPTKPTKPDQPVKPECIDLTEPEPKPTPSPSRAAAARDDGEVIIVLSDDDEDENVPPRPSKRASPRSASTGAAPTDLLPPTIRTTSDRTLALLSSYECTPSQEAALQQFLDHTAPRTASGRVTRGAAKRRSRAAAEGGVVLVLEDKAENALEALRGQQDRAVVEIMGVPVTAALLREVVTPAGWLNDEAINGYLNLMGQRHPKVKFMSTFFYTTLVQGGKYDYTRVRRWTRKTPRGVFAYDRVCVPINRGNSHWSMAAIDITTGRLTYHDSLRSTTSTAILNHLLHYLQDEWVDKILPSSPAEAWDTGRWQIATSGQRDPRQMDGGSCGVFVCMFARRIAGEVVGSSDGGGSWGQAEVDRLRRKLAFDLVEPFLEAIGIT